MATLGGLVVSLSAETSRFEQAMSKAEYQAKKSSDNMVNSLKTVGVAAAGMLSFSALYASFTRITDMEAALLKMASRLNTSVETLSSLGVVARKTGMDAEAFNMTLQRIEKSAGAAAKGIEQGSGKFDEYGEEIGKGGAAWRELGIDAEKYLKLPLDQKLLALSAAMQQNVEPSRQLSLMLELGGRSAGAMIIPLKEGPEAIQKMIDRMVELGIVTTEMAKRGAEVKSATGDMTMAFSAFARELADNVSPRVTSVTKGLTDMIIAARKSEGIFTIFDPEKAFKKWKELGAKMPWPFSQEGPPPPAAPKLTYPPIPSYKEALTEPSISPGEKLTKGLKAAKEQAQTVVDLFDQMAWAADDSEKELKLITEYLEKMGGYQKRLVSGQVQYASEMAGLSPMLTDQLKWKELAIQKELELKFATLDRELDEKKINQAIYDQEKGMIALVTQGKKMNIERERWATEGIGGGIQLFALELRQESATAVAFGIRDGLKGAKGYADQAITDLIMSPFTKKKMDFKHIGLDIATSLVSGLVKMGTTKIFSFLTEGAMGMVNTWQAAQEAMTAASAAGEAARLGTMAGGASQGVSILESLAKSAILVDAGRAGAATYASVSEIPVVGWILAPIAAAAAFAATLAFGSRFGGGGYNASGNMGYGGPSPYHAGGHLQPLLAHEGWPSLSSHEVPFIGLDTERVLSPRQTRDYEAGLREGGGSTRSETIIHAPTNVTINPRQQMTQRDFDRAGRMAEKALNRTLSRRGKKLGE